MNLKNPTTVGASMYGGPTDPTSGTKGYKGDDLSKIKNVYAELNMGTALGNLPYGTPLKIAYNGKTIVAYKKDIGLGGTPVQGHARRIDLWYQAAAELGFSGVGLVTVSLASAADVIHDPTQADDPADQAGNKVKQIADIPSQVAAFLGQLGGAIFSESFWLRSLKFIGGAILILFGIILIGRKASFGSGAAAAAAA